MKTRSDAKILIVENVAGAKIIVKKGIGNKIYYYIDIFILSYNHCKLTGGEGQIQMTLLLRLCDPVAPLVLILRTSVKKSKLIRLHFTNSKHFCSFQ